MMIPQIQYANILNLFIQILNLVSLWQQARDDLEEDIEDMQNSSLDVVMILNILRIFVLVLKYNRKIRGKKKRLTKPHILMRV